MKTVLIHGLGQTSSAWDKVKQNLNNKDDIISIDLFSDIESPISYEKVYSKFEKILNGYNVKVRLCGLSLGGILALNYASRYPKKVDSLVLIAIPYIVSQELKIKQNEMFNQNARGSFYGVRYEEK